ncbi:MAG: methyltransferase domain-containing protein [Desulfococcaceae bacterium]|nr:methyltransferase domain-containing protein [Desulfococcaceae bacterium]
MNRIDSEAVADIRFEMKWESPEARHTERYEGMGVNFWRDFFPADMREELMGKNAGYIAESSILPGRGIPAFNPGQNPDLKREKFNSKHMQGYEIYPRTGRFYPKGILRDMYNVFPQNTEPFRCTKVQNGHLGADFNHPLAGYELKMNALVRNVSEKKDDRGGGCNDWLDVIATGPGMQARWREQKTDFFSDSPYAREDEGPDDNFYKKPRFVQHLDSAAIRVIKELHGNMLQDGMKVLDLMSSWTSHLPDNFRAEGITGLGMNKAELEKNTALTDRIVHDLNQRPELPFADGSFDAVICTASVEYLIHPEKVFDEMARVLKKDGTALMTFSNRWFPPKAIRIWKEITEFERMGLVLEYFLGSGKFKNPESFSCRGLPRPWDDKYYPQMRFSDPVFAVWGRKA